MAPWGRKMRRALRAGPRHWWPRGGHGSASSGSGNGSGYAQGSGTEAAAAQEDAEFRENVRQQLAGLKSGQHVEYGNNLGARHRDLVQEVADGLGLWSHAEEGVLFVGHLQEFALQVRQQLQEVKPDEHFEFPMSLSDAQRRVVRVVAAELGMLTQVEGKGDEQRIVVLRPGDFAQLVRQQLGALGPGDSRAFPAKITGGQRRLILAISDEFGLWAHESHDSDTVGVEVFNLAAADMRERLAQLAPGQHLDLQDLSQQERQAAQCLARDLGLSLQLQRRKAASVLTVANLRDFLQEAREAISALSPGEAKAFPPQLSSLQSEELRRLAQELECRTELVSERKKQHMSVTRLAVDEQPAERDSHGDGLHIGGEGEGEDEASSDDESVSSMISQIFDMYATGEFKKDRIFLRFPDLGNFAETVADVMPEKHKVFCRFSGVLEHIFDDTLQLQWDLGVRTRKGLNKKWFQVFIQKAMKRVGIQIVSLLFDILNDT